MLMNARKIFACLLVCGLTVLARAEYLKCDICGSVLTNQYYKIVDRVTGKTNMVCMNCEALPDRCFICDLPVKPDAETLPDGRMFCARDAKEVVDSDEEAKRICGQVRDDLHRLLSRFMTFPDTNVMVSIVDRFYLESLFKAPGHEDACVTVYGATHTHHMPNGRFIHSVSVLSNLKPEHLMAVCAHEYTHTWIGQNVSAARQAALDRDTLEAFCELVAYKYMDSRNETYEMQVIRKNSYTKGQILTLIEADNRYGFEAIVDWMKNGEDLKLDWAGLDRVRSLQDDEVKGENPYAALFYVPVTAPTPVPDTLELKGISGAPQHRYVIINDATFRPMERASVRVGLTNVSVRCLEIRDKSALIQVNGSNERQELFLRPDK